MHKIFSPKLLQRCYNIRTSRFYHYKDGGYGYKHIVATTNNINFDIESKKYSGDNVQGVKRLIQAYRNHGHKFAKVNPIWSLTQSSTEIALSEFGLQLEDTISEGETQMSVADLVNKLQQTYCGGITIETSCIDDFEEKEWICETYSNIINEQIDSSGEKLKICKILQDSQALDRFLGIKFPTLKRYSGEGAESMLVFIDKLISDLSLSGIEEVVMGLAHRGRNNILVGLLNFPFEVMVRKIIGLSEFPSEALAIATGDVLSHFRASTTIQVEDGNKIHVSVVSNPSHLEAHNTVAIGKCRGKQQTLGEGDYSSISTDRRGDKATCVLIHGDGAFAGQGIVMEGLNMSKLSHFDIGGTIHLIVNNQVGFTTPPTFGRSSTYATDIGKMTGCPVIHVNGDQPELVVKAAQFAVEYRNRYRKDVIIDMLCFRLHGHNELDDPTFTHPLSYGIIKDKLSVPDHYSEQLKSTGILDSETLEKWKNDSKVILNKGFEQAQTHEPEATYLEKGSTWENMKIPQVGKTTTWDTGCNIELLRFVGAKAVEVSKEYSLHKSLMKNHIPGRIEKLENNLSIEWSFAESLAIGSLLHQGYNVRLCGQDVGRGTFGHRHAMVVCQQSGSIYMPLNHMTENQKGHIEVVNSLLSEEAVLGFEYGMSIEHENRLVIWEAQFGDFFNGAQIIVDTFITSGEVKWMYQSGLVMLLPHGYDGAGPEHSSCRIERFLQCTNSNEDGIDGDDVNMSVCHPTTSAQYFHLLRRQMLRNFRKPLIVASPKVLLRFQPAMSKIEELKPGTQFRPVLGDVLAKSPQTVKRVIICSGKHYYAIQQELEKRRQSNAEDSHDTAVVRIEELCPFPAAALQSEFERYPNATKFIWSQEEPRNMGPWNFVSPRFENILGVKLKYAGRPSLAAPAVGINSLHLKQVNELMEDTFAWLDMY